MGQQTGIFSIFSGTGNSYRVARWIGEFYQKNGYNIDYEMIGDQKPEQRGDFRGIIFPTHGFTAPFGVFKYVLRLPRGEKQTAIVVATRAGMRIGKWIPDGISGSGLWVIALLLLLRGYRIQGMIAINMPSNWLSLHSGPGEKTCNEVNHRGQLRAEQFSQKMINEKNHLLTINNLFELTLGVILLPLTLVYLFFGRFFLAKSLITSEQCNGCGLCAKSCPFNSIKMINKRPFWKFSCESCMRCMGYCPQKGIESPYLWFLPVVWATLIPWGIYLAEWIPGLHLTVATLLGYLLLYIIVWVGYQLLFWVTGVKLVRKWLTTITPTRFYKRYHAEGVALKDLTPPDSPQR